MVFIEKVENNGKKGHMVIAYDYDEENDIVYTHYGWGAFQVRNYIFSEGYEYIKEYFAMSPKDLHSHCNNYIVDGVAKCSCSLPNHKHVYEYKSQNATTHQVSCRCGFYKSEAHIFNSRGTGSMKNYIYCGDCGYRKLDDGKDQPIIVPIG